MIAYILRRLLYALITFFGITVATFALIHSVPGDPARVYAGIRASEARVQTIRHEFHLDEPVPKQDLLWLRGILTFDFGRSIANDEKVSTQILDRIPRTVLLNAIALALAAAIGIPVGLWSAARPGRLFDRGSAVSFFLLYSLPTFWIGLLLMEFFSVRLGILPLLGVTSDGYADMSFGQQMLDRAQHLALPVITLAYGELAIFARFSRSALREVIGQDFVTTARAKGAGEGAVVWRHAARNALLPIITLAGLIVPSLISSSVIVEDIFQWDGIGQLYFDSIRTRDYPTVMALTVVTAIVTLLSMLAADLLYAVADPRVRLEEQR